MIEARTLWLVVALLGGVGGAACNGAGTSGGSAPVVQADAAKEAVQARPRPAGDPQPTLPTGYVEFERAAPRAPLTVKVEVAATDQQRQMGLMFREQMGELEGMLFIFPTERHNSFWMRNTLLPLDMFFIDSDWTVVGVVENAEPLTESPREVAGMSQYVLEVNAGFAKRQGFGAGDKLRFIAPGERP
ncbi:MAG: DUF192 domain-containing protein [Myxococcales bacterium]